MGGQSHPLNGPIPYRGFVWAVTKVERYNRLLSEEFLYARTWRSELERTAALEVLNQHYNYHRPHGAHDGHPPASATPAAVNNVLASYT